MKRFKVLQAHLIFMMLILSAFLSAGCGSGGGTGHWDPSSVPTVTAVLPLNNATGVAINTKVITATFSEPMDPDTLTTASFTLSCGGTPVTGGGAVTYLAASNRATLPLPAATNLPENTLCTATITTAAENLAGNALADNFVWTFRTAPDTTAPTVTAVVPLNNAAGVAVNTKVITAAFSEPMDPATLTTASFTLSCGGTSITGGGAVTYLLAGSVATLPLPAATDLPENTLCTATITTAAEDVAGNPLAGNYVWTFRTAVTITPDTTRPRVLSTFPATTTTGVPTNTAITATFTEAMAPATITAASFTLTGPGATPVAGVAIPVTYAVGSRTATFTPAAALLPSTLYTATITTAATDLAGNQLAGNQAPLPAASNYVWTFTTAAAPVPPANVSALSSSIKPAAGAGGVCPGATISLTFVVPSGLKMDPLSLTAGTTFIVTGPSPATTVITGSVVLDATGLIATFTPLNPLADGTYAVTIRGGALGVRDLALPANTMVSDFGWTFTVLDSGACVAGPDLGSASTFGIAATAGVTNTPLVPLTVINGDVVLDPVAGAICNSVAIDAAGGFGLCGGSPPTINGTVISPLFNLGVTSPTIKADLLAAFLSITPPAGPPAAGSLGGATNMPAGTTLGAVTGSALVPGDNYFTPGVYQSLTSIMITGDLTLDALGDPNAVFVFQSSTSTGTAAAVNANLRSRILLVGGAKASNVWWQVGSSATLGAYSEFQGNILASASITMETGATSCGRLLAGAYTAGAFVFDGNVVSVPGQPFLPPAAVPAYSTVCQ